MLTSLNTASRFHCRDDGPEPLPPGTDLLHHVATGEVCDIWKVCDRQTGQPWAWKRLRPEMADNTPARDALSMEAYVGRCVQGVFTVRIERDFTEQEPPSLLREWLEGESLGRRLERVGRLSVGTAFWVARQIAQGLQELQQAGVSHGDVKPANIFLEPNGRVRLIDTGFASALQQAGNGRHHYALKGTPEYLAPELLSTNPADPVAADVYSLGVVLYEMLSGRVPFVGENTADVLRLHRQSRPPAVEKHCPDLPDDAARLLERLLCKQPLRRPGHPDELVRHLLEVELQTMPQRRGIPATVSVERASA